VLNREHLIFVSLHSEDLIVGFELENLPDFFRVVLVVVRVDQLVSLN